MHSIKRVYAFTFKNNEFFMHSCKRLSVYSLKKEAIFYVLRKMRVNEKRVFTYILENK